MKETKEIRMEKGKPYPLGWTENADGSVNLAAVLERSKECGALLYPRRGGAPRRLTFREEDRIGKICCMKLVGLDAQEYEYNFYCGEEVITDPKARRICGNENGAKKFPRLFAATAQRMRLTGRMTDARRSLMRTAFFISCMSEGSRSTRLPA